MIIYFSGTGNSRCLAFMLKEKLNDTMVNSSEFIKQNKKGEFKSDKPFIFVCPTYAWQIPRIFRDFIKNSSFKGNKNAYFIMSCGSDIGNAGEGNRELCRHMGFNYKGTVEVIMPENYIAVFSSPSKEEEERIIKDGTFKLEKKVNYIIKEQDIPEKRATALDLFKSGAINKCFYPVVVKAKPFYAKDNCIGCHKCEEVCALNNIKITDGKPIWGNNCTHCMACISYCPVEAIEYGKKSLGKRRYICPDYSRLN